MERGERCQRDACDTAPGKIDTLEWMSVTPPALERDQRGTRMAVGLSHTIAWAIWSCSLPAKEGRHDVGIITPDICHKSCFSFN